MRRINLMLGLCAAAALAALSGPATVQAQQAALSPAWPTRAVKFIVPFGPGAGADIGGRMFADKLSQRWGQPVVIENKPGGDSIIAINAFLSANDDHTFLFGPAGNFVVHPFVYSKLSYDPKELIPVARASNTILALAVKKVLQSAIANAENNQQLDIDRLYVAEATTGKQMVMKRWMPRARGRVGRIEKPFSNLTIVVREREEKA